MYRFSQEAPYKDLCAVAMEIRIQIPPRASVGFGNRPGIREMRPRKNESYNCISIFAYIEFEYYYRTRRSREGKLFHIYGQD